MPSRAETRGFLELVARTAVVLLLAAALWRVVQARRAEATPSVQVRLTGAERAATRDSLAALARSGVTVPWSGEIPALAAMAEGVREPAPATRVSVVADGAVVLGDSLGTIDSLAAGSGSLVVAGVRGALRAGAGSAMARVDPAKHVAPGRVLVLGRAGWESKFVIAALEEAGWSVDAELAVVDTLTVRQGAGARGGPRLGTHAAVVVLDSAPRAAAAIARFVAAGGGLVLGGEGAANGAHRALAPARTVRAVRPLSRAFDGVGPMDALPLHALEALRADALVLERREGRIAAAARRVGAGRVVQAGYGDTWRWRMEGGADAAAAHRAHWSRLVGSVAHVAVPPDVVTSPGTPRGTSAHASAEGAPLAATVHALGAASPVATARTPTGPPLPGWLGALILALLLAEWASRRTRGLA